MPGPVIDARSTEIRPARREDVAAIENIERRMWNDRNSIGCATIEPWDARRIHDEIRNGTSIIGANGPLITAFIIGHWYPKPATIEIIRIGVDPYYRRRGIGTVLLSEILYRASIFRNVNPIRSIVCCVPESELLSLCKWLAARTFCDSKLDRRSGLIRMTAKVQHVHR